MPSTSTPLSNWLDTRDANDRLIRWLYGLLEPPKHYSTLEWVNTELRLSPKNCAKPGRYSTDFAPYLDEILESFDDPTIPIVVAQKPAQWTWTTAIAGAIGKRIGCQDAGGIVVMFPREKSGKDFMEEKFRPMAEVTPAIRDHVDLRRGSKNGNSWGRVDFGSGFLKIVGSNTPADVKSTSAPLTIIEEPSDANRNVKGQGNTIKLLQERNKSYPDAKTIFGGTPTIKGLCEVSDGFENSDRRYFWVRCHKCRQTHNLSERAAYDNLKCEDGRWESAYYECPHCHAHWTDNERIRNILLARNEQRAGATDCGWIPSAEFRGIRGYKGSELMSSLPGSRHAEQMRKRLEAERKLAEGDDADMIAFVNSTMGEAYEYQSGLPEVAALADRAEDYPELVCPWGGIKLTAGVDVQHDRLAVVIRAWGRGEESWLLYWGEIYGPTMLLEQVDKETGEIRLQGAWVDLEALLTRPIRHVNGAALRIAAVSIDSSDGQTSDAVYGYVRRRLGRGYMAVKGDSHDAEGKREIFIPPKQAVDTDNKNQKAHKFGLRPFIVGTARAKDLILGADASAGRIKLKGSGPGRMHAYQGVRPDYYEQLTSEIKAPSPKHRRVRVWQLKSGVRNEALDCEVYALHAARSLKLHLWREERWTAEEMKIKQADLLPVEPDATSNSPEALEASAGPPSVAAHAAPPSAAPTTRPIPQGPAQPRRPGGFSATSW
jgi:phage terminase large subunit GpA-like protein